MPDNIIFTGEFDGSEISKGIDGMINSFKKAQDQGAISTETLNKMQGAIEGVNTATQELQKTTGKGIAPSLNDGKIAQQTDAIKKNITDMANTVSKKVQEAKDKLSALVTTQNQYKNSLNEITGVIKANEKEYNSLVIQLQKLIDAEKGGSIEAKNLRDQIRALSANTSEFKGQLSTTQASLATTTAQIKIQSVAVKDAEKAGASWTMGLSHVWGGLRKIAYFLPGIGIAGLVSLISGPVIEAFTAWIATMEKSDTKAKLLTDTVHNAGESFQKAVADVSQLRIEIDLAKNGFLDKDDVVKHYNETIGKTAGLVKTLDEAEKSLVKNGQAFVQMQLYKAVATIALESASKKAFEAVEISRKKQEEFENAADRSNLFNITSEADSKRATAQIKSNADERRNAKAKAATDEAAELNQIATDYNKAAATIAQAFGLKFFDTKPPKKEKQRKEVQNIYEQELLKLQSDIAKITEKGFTNEGTITAAIEADFKKRDNAFQKAFKNKQLTAGQLSSLQENLRSLQDLTLKKGLADFATQKAAYLSQINDQLVSLQNEENLKRISNIKDGFERERQTIIAETEKTTSDLGAKRDKTISDLLKNSAKNGLTEKDLQPQINSIKSTYSRLLDDLAVLSATKLQKLSFDTFEKLSEDAKRLLNSGNLGVSQGALINIQGLAAQFQSGKITYEAYQKALTQIVRAEANERFQIERQFLEAEIQVRQAKLASDKTLTDDQITKLRDEITSLQQRLADATKGNVTTGAADTKKDRDEKIQGLVNYANAIGQVVQSVISFWQLANEAEQKSLARSIALQDRRVEAARNIAAKGNAEYLRLEEERQQALLIKQENAARRTLAINAAIQGSQVLVALVSAIAEGAKVGGAIGAILDVAAIVGAIASAYAIAQSLKPQQPSFFVGTEDTGEGGNVDSKGGFNAILHPKERVFNAEHNKQLRGLSNKEVIERVTENYRVKPAPSLNMAAMEQAVNSGTRSEVMKMEGVERELKLNNQLQLKTHRLLKSMGVSVNVDRNGLAVSVLEAADEIVKNKKI
jgi:hypothetical protein